MNRILIALVRFNAALLLFGTAFGPFAASQRAQGPDETVLLTDDFEDGTADKWELESGWQVRLDDGNYVLSGQGHTWARLPHAEQLGTIESFESRINLLAGSIHVNYRLTRGGSRYFVRLEQQGLSLLKSVIKQPVPQQGDPFDHVQLSRQEKWLGFGTWHTFRIVGIANRIEVYVDDELQIEYTDDDNPYLGGSVAFETLDDSHALVDNVVLKGQPPPSAPPGLTWTFTGGPRGGIGYDIRLHPLNPSILWVTDAYAGAHYSLDGGLTWLAKNEGITARTGPSGDAVPIFSLAIDLHNPNIIWVGTIGTRGVFKSVDGGETWTEMDNGIAQMPNMEFRGFTVDPTDSNIVYVGGNSLADPVANDQRGFIYKTTDGGQNWRLLYEPDALVRWIIVDPTDHSVIYASTGIFDRNAIQPEGILKSTDGGQTWSNINNGLTNLVVGALAVHPTNPQILIAGTGKAGRFVDEPSEIYGGVFKTIDGGEHWRQVDPIHATTCFIFSAVAFAPSNPNIVYADAGHLMLRSQDGGETWTQFNVSAGGENRGTPIALTVHPTNPDILYMNSYDGGVFMSTDGGRTWQDASKGYTGSQAWDIAVDPSDPAYVVVASKNGVHVSTDGGGRWWGRNTTGEINNMLAVAIDPSNRNTFLVGRQIDGSVWRTADGGASWTNVLGPLGEDTATGRRSIYRIAFTPSDPAIVYAATGIETMMGAIPRDTAGPGVYKSTNGGRTWSAINHGLEETTLNIFTVAVHPTDANIVYIGTLSNGVYKTTTGGDTWFAARQGLLPNEIRSVAIDPLNPETIYAGAELGGIWKSIDGGATWEQISYGMPPEASIRCIAVDPVTEGVVYAADRSTGVYRSTDGGQTWIAVNTGLRMRAVNSLALSGDGQHLYAATEGEGVFRLDLNGQPPAAAPQPEPERPTQTPPEGQTPTAPTPQPEQKPGICGSALLLPLALLGLLWGGGKSNMKRSVFFLASGVVLLALAILFACVPVAPVPTPTPSLTASPSPIPPIVTPEGASVSGVVLDLDGAPLPGATVRIQATTNQTLTDDDGRFVLTGLEAGVPVTVSAWKDKYYCAKVENVTPPASDIIFTMRLVQTNDNPNYQWIPPTGENSCYSCKPGVTQVWLDNDAHGKSATNVRFLTMYNGTDVNGNRSPLTRYGYSRDYGRFPLRPNPAQPYYGPGYKLDFSDTAGNCAACHTPGVAIDAPYGTDPNMVSGVNKFGVHCDYCHKIADVKLNPATSLPFPNMPGVLSQDIRRPFPEDPDRYQIFFGSFDDDNVPMEDTFLPLIKQSQWCAPCHFGVFWDTVVYNSFGEWLESPYSDPETGKTCQQCHIPAPTLLDGLPITNVAPGLGGVKRDPMTIPGHTFPGAANEELLQNSVTMTVDASREGDKVTVEVTILNDKTGHHIPTDSPLRQMILLVQAEGPDGTALTQVDGPTVPDWGGVGDPSEGYYAGLPGKAYAKILMELWTEVAPTGAYWNPTRVVSDNRIPALGSDTSTYVFQTSEVSKTSEVSVQVMLLFRRAFKELMDQKGWDVPDIVMEQQTINLP